MFSWWINMIGLVVSVIGTVLMFLGSPRDSKFTDQIPSTLIAQMNDKQEQKNYDKRHKFSRYGLITLLLGFIIQAISQISQYP